MNKLNDLRKQVVKLAIDSKISDNIIMKYDGEVIGTYECWAMGEPDSKSPLEWLNGNITFCINLKGRDINKVTLEMTHDNKRPWPFG